MVAVVTAFSRVAEPESQCIARALRRRDSEFIGRMVSRYHYRLLRYLVYWTSRREQAEDLVQETWLRVLERAGQYNGRLRFEPWLFSIARNLAIDHLRKQQTAAARHGMCREDEGGLNLPAPDSASPFFAAAKSEDAKRIAGALGALEPIYREALLLRFQEELSLAEIAQVAGAPIRPFRRGFIAACRCSKLLSEEAPMLIEDHEKARFLLHRSLVEGISLEERHWLDAHVGQCAECTRYADLSARAVGALDWFALELDQAAAHRVENVVRSRAERMRSAEAHAKSLWIGTAAAIFLTFTGSAVAWRPLVWVASEWNVPSRVWQIIFAAFWMLPSLLLALLPLFRRRLLGEDSDSNGQTV